MIYFYKDLYIYIQANTVLRESTNQRRIQRKVDNAVDVTVRSRRMRLQKVEVSNPCIWFSFSRHEIEVQVNLRTHITIAHIQVHLVLLAHLHSLANIYIYMKSYS